MESEMYIGTRVPTRVNGTDYPIYNREFTSLAQACDWAREISQLPREVIVEERVEDDTYGILYQGFTRYYDGLVERTEITVDNR